jgi:predicted aspartyl protease
MLVALIGIGAVSIAQIINSVHDVETPEPAPRYGPKEDKAEIKDVPSPKRKPARVPSRNKLQARRETDRRPQSPQERESLTPGKPERKDLVEDESSGSRTTDDQKAELRHEQPGETYSAREWFEKGRALDDESEGEIECYRKAIELDPEFAPAYYCLGAIYCRRANYELADKEFAKFLKHASEADRETYDIYLYYSPSDVARLSEEKIKGQASAEETEKEMPSEAEKKGAEATEKETTRQTSEETAEPTEKETTEPSGEETAEPSNEETGEETTEEVMTIVRFMPVDGHILVPVVLNGFLEARVLVDTGAGITILSGELARQLQLEEQAGHSITLKTMAMDIQAQLATLSSIQVGNLIQNNLHVAITDLPLGEKRKFDGILGMDFMKDYKIQIDNENNRILLSPAKKSR